MIENAVARVIMMYCLDDETIDFIVDSTIAYFKQKDHELHIEAMENELVAVQQAISNLMKAIEAGIITPTTRTRLLDLEEQQAKLSAKINTAKAERVEIDRDDLIAGLQLFRTGDIKNKKFLAKLFNTFLLAVYLYDDNRLKIVFSFTGNHNNIEIPLELDNDCPKKLGVFAGLGHPISDSDTGESVALRSGEIVPCEITGCSKGTAGSPGELKGHFLSAHAIGTIRINGENGVYGRTRAQFSGQLREIAFAQEVVTGPEIWATIEGETPRAYRIQIERVSDADPRRNLVIRVTDPSLLSATGGIVQGMSGSPILQNGRLVGAVTHVLVDPTRGYGIFAQTMLEQAKNAAEKCRERNEPEDFCENSRKCKKFPVAFMVNYGKI